MRRKSDKTQQRRFTLVMGVVALGLGALSGAAWAQRDPAYEAARAAGQVGEKMDGYLGIVGAETPDLRRMVSDINIKRRAVYAEKAQAANATMEEYALTAGCLQIARTVPGEMYQSPGGWKKRTSSPPERDSRCP